MGQRWRVAVSMSLAAAFLLGSAPAPAFDWMPGGASREIPGGAAASDRAEAAISRWPDASQLLARKLLAELGAPDQTMPHYLSWSARGPFHTITVFSDRDWSHQPGILLESVGYRVPVGKWRALSAFGHGVSYDVILDELVACSDGEETDALALNLADEVIQGRRSPDQARALYDQTLSRSYAGKASRSLLRLTFDPRDRVKPRD